MERQYPPASLVLLTQAPRLSGSTNGALLDWALDLRSALGSCNADKGAIGAWMLEQPTAPLADKR